MAAEVDERRHVAIMDGGRRFDVALAGGATLADALAVLGVGWDGERWALVSDDGSRLDAGTPGSRLDDGAVIALVDLSAPAVPRASARSEAAGPAILTYALGGMLSAFGLVLAALALLDPGAIGTVLRAVLVAVSAAGSLVAVLRWALRSRSHDEPAAPVVGGLTLAFSAGVMAVPPLPAAGGEVAVLVGLSCSGVLAALLAVTARRSVPRTQAGVAAALLIALAVLWGAAVLLRVPASAPCAVALGAVPVALRALPAMLMDAPPGMFVDLPRFQSLRWSVREQVPPPVNTVRADRVSALVERSSTRRATATVLLCATAAVCTPWALDSFDTADPIVFGGQIGLACCVVVALVLGARTGSTLLLRWTPRAAAVVVVVVSLVAAARLTDLFGLTLAACATLAAGVATAFIVIPVARGARSLFWSRLGDVLESLAVALALPAGLLAAGTIDILRGVMAS